MYRSILVPLDGSQLSEHALPLACALAERSGATLHLLHVHTPHDIIVMEGMPVIDEDLHSLGRTHEQLYLADVQQRISTALPVSVVWHNPDREGLVVNTITAYIAAEDIDLVVMTTHGRTGFERLWLGSVAEALMRHSSAPVLLVRPGGAAPDLKHPPQIGTILVPLDGSALSERIVEPAERLGRLCGAGYLLFHVVVPLIIYTPGPFIAPVAADPGYTEQMQITAQHYLAQVADRMQEDDEAVQSQVVVDTQPSFAILEAARQHHADLIALATHGRGGLGRLMLGSVADKVLRGTTLPVLLYHPPTA